MTDEQIIKALECCVTDDGDDCFQCPYGDIVYKPGNGGCVNRCHKDALDLIMCQKVEIERLLQKLQQAQSEAIYKLVKKFKDRIVNKYEYVQVGIFDELDNLVKEITEVQG